MQHPHTVERQVIGELDRRRALEVEQTAAQAKDDKPAKRATKPKDDKPAGKDATTSDRPPEAEEAQP